jgi:DNA-binding LytR/AlgR family response regulator
MTKLRVAVLEDDTEMLDQLVRWLKGIENIEVVTATDDAIKFKERVRIKAPDALLLDIEVNGDKQAGLDLAEEVALPVLFISGRTRDNLEKIEQIQRMREHIPVEHLTKTYTEAGLKQAISRLSRLIHALGLDKPIPIRLKRNGEEILVPPGRIVFIEVHPDAKEAASQNKRIHFTHRPPETLANITLGKVNGTILPDQEFVQISSKCVVNRRYITQQGTDGVKVEAIGESGKPVGHFLKITDTYRGRLG